MQCSVSILSLIFVSVFFFVCEPVFYDHVAVHLSNYIFSVQHTSLGEPLLVHLVMTMYRLVLNLMTDLQ